MALVTTVFGVVGVLAAMALLLWFSAFIESRHLGPVAAQAEDCSAAGDGDALEAARPAG